MPKKIEISSRTIFFILGVLAVIWFLIQIREILFFLFISLILVAALHSPVEWLAQKKIPRPLSILIIYTFLFIILGGAVGLLIPPFIEQTTKLITTFPVLLQSLNKLFLYQLPIQDLLKSLGGQISGLGGNLFKYTLGFFGNLVGFLAILVFTFYLLLRWKNLGKFLSANFAPKEEERIVKILNRIEIGLGNWVRGQLILCFIVGLMAFIGLTFLRVPYVLSLAIFAGILEILPIIGPFISAIPAVLLALTVSPILALATVALYVLIQQLENQLIVPKVMQKAVGIDPLITLLALMIGGKLMGILGVFLAVPAVVLLKILFREILESQKEIT